MGWIIIGIILLVIVILVSMAVKKVAAWEQGVVFHLGRLVGTKGPGIFFIIPFIYRLVKVDLRVITMDIPEVEAITNDYVNVRASARINFRVVDPVAATRAHIRLNHISATSEIAIAAFRSLLEESTREQLEGHRSEVSRTLRQKIDGKELREWGVKVEEAEVQKMVFT